MEGRRETGGKVEVARRRKERVRGHTDTERKERDVAWVGGRGEEKVDGEKGEGGTEREREVEGEKEIKRARERGGRKREREVTA